MEPPTTSARPLLPLRNCLDPITCPTKVAIYRAKLVWRFRSPHHSYGESDADF
jgi:hypothetical protein